MLSIKIHHVAIQTSCFDKAYAFYTDFLGFRVVKEPFSFKGKRTMAWLDAGSIYIELYSVKKGETPEPYCETRLGTDHIAFEVEDLDVIIDKFKQYGERYGIRVLKEPFIPPTGDENQPRVAFIEGVDGEEIEIREIQM